MDLHVDWYFNLSESALLICQQEKLYGTPARLIVIILGLQVDTALMHILFESRKKKSSVQVKYFLNV